MKRRSGTLAFSQQRHVNRDEVSISQRFFEFHIPDPASVAAYSSRNTQIFEILDRFNKVVVLIGRVVTQDIHVETGAFTDHRQPNPAGAEESDRLAGHLIAEERQIRMPVAPLVLASKMLGGPQLAGQRAHNEEGKLGGGLG